METKTHETAARELLTVEQFCQREPAFKIGGIRWLIFKQSENLESEGALVRLGRRVLIDRHRFIDLVCSQRLIASRRPVVA